MKRLLVVCLFLFVSYAFAQSCVPGNGVTCTANLNLWIPPLNYQNWYIPLNSNFNTIDSAAANWVKLTTPNTFTGSPQTAPIFNATTQFNVNGVQIASSNLSDGANLPKLNAANNYTAAINTFLTVNATVDYTGTPRDARPAVPIFFLSVSFVLCFGRLAARSSADRGR